MIKNHISYLYFISISRLPICNEQTTFKGYNHFQRNFSLLYLFSIKPYLDPFDNNVLLPSRHIIPLLRYHQIINQADHCTLRYMKKIGAKKKSVEIFSSYNRQRKENCFIKIISNFLHYFLRPFQNSNNWFEHEPSVIRSTPFVGIRWDSQLDQKQRFENKETSYFSFILAVRSPI